MSKIYRSPPSRKASSETDMSPKSTCATFLCWPTPRVVREAGRCLGWRPAGRAYARTRRRQSGPHCRQCFFRDSFVGVQTPPETSAFCSRSAVFLVVCGLPPYLFRSGPRFALVLEHGPDAANAPAGIYVSLDRTPQRSRNARVSGSACIDRASQERSRASSVS